VRAESAGMNPRLNDDRAVVSVESYAGFTQMRNMLSECGNALVAPDAISVRGVSIFFVEVARKGAVWLTTSCLWWTCCA